MTSQEQIDKECDAMVEQYTIKINKNQDELLRTPLIPSRNYEVIVSGLNFAILHQKGIVEELEGVCNEIPRDSDYYWSPEDRLIRAKQILETLKSRVK